MITIAGKRLALNAEARTLRSASLICSAGKLEIWRAVSRSTVCSRRYSTTLRIRRDTRGNYATLIAITTFCTDPRVSAITAIANRICTAVMASMTAPVCQM